MTDADFRAYNTNVTLNDQMLPIDARCTELLPQFAEEVERIELSEFINKED